jgi:AraC family transcriptional regulator
VAPYGSASSTHDWPHLYCRRVHLVAILMPVDYAKGTYSFGRELSACQLDGIRVSETSMPAGLHLGEHAHEPGQICFVLEGEYRERVGEREHRLRAGALQFHAPGERHSNDFLSESETLTLLISIDRSRWVRFAAHRPITPDAFLRNCALEIRRELADADEAARAAVEAWSILSMSVLARRSEVCDGIEPLWLREALSIIEMKLCEPISLTTVAALVGVHRATLAAGFRRFRNRSIGEWIRKRRVERAMQMLTSTRIPLCEIATHLGFCDQAHMTRVFRSATGVSPSAYRAARR